MTLLPMPAQAERRPLTDLTDAELAALSASGDHASFEVLFSRYQVPIRNYVMRLMSDGHDAEEMTQDVFTKAWLALITGRLRGELKFSAWVYRVATNHCFDELRHRKLIKWTPWATYTTVFHPSQVGAEAPEHDALQSERASEVQEVLARLVPKYRTYLVLREYHGLSYDEIGEILNTTRAAVKSNLYRAREAFRQVYVRTYRNQAAAGVVQP